MIDSMILDTIDTKLIGLQLGMCRELRDLLELSANSSPTSKLLLLSGVPTVFF